MASFEINWERKQQVSIEIEVETAEEAYNKWSEGDYGTIPVSYTHLTLPTKA